MKIRVDAAHGVSGLFQAPKNPAACLVLAHGAGAGMTHPFMAAVADGLSERGVATLRFQFPAMEAGSGQPDRPSLAQATVRAAVAEARELAPSVPLFAGGKSFGGRMASQAQVEAPLPGVSGLVFFGFPLHPAKTPAVERGDHLARAGVPLLFLQGTRDALAEMPLLAKDHRWRRPPLRVLARFLLRSRRGLHSIDGLHLLVAGLPWRSGRAYRLVRLQSSVSAAA